MKIKIAYKAKNGRLFESRKAAKSYENKEELRQDIKSFLNETTTVPKETTIICDYFLYYAKDIKKMLNKYKTL